MICPQVSMVKGGMEISGVLVVGGDVAGGTDGGVVVVVVVVVVRTGAEVGAEFEQPLAPSAAMITVPATTARGCISYF
jgi:hypothetical protein